MKHHLKIGLVLDDSLDTPDGVQQYVITLGMWLSQQGHEVHYLVGQTVRTDIPHVHSLAKNWKVTYNGNRLSIPLPANKKHLRALLEAEKFDVLHVQTPYSPFLAGRLLRLVPAETAVIGTFHVLPYTKSVIWTNKLLALINRRTSKRFDAMIANTQPTKVFADACYGFESVIIPNPFPLKAFQATAHAASVSTIVFLGRLVPRKGALELLEAVAYLRQQTLYDKPFTVIIGGKGPLLERLLKARETYGLESIVSFPGFIAEAEKSTFLATADIAVFPSLSGESFGISLLEAMASAHGVVLGGDNPGYRAVLEPLNTNRLINPSDTSDFAKRLAQWLTEATARQRAATEQKKYVEQFDINLVGTKIIELYADALRKRR